jgi:signal transduction histidine kinase
VLVGERQWPSGEDTGQGVPFEEGDAVAGLKPLSADLRPEVREFAIAMRRLFLTTGMTVRQFAACAHFGPALVGRCLGGAYVPEKSFLDLLLSYACDAHNQQVTPEMREYLYRLHREALLAEDPARYRLQVASDGLEQAVLEQEQVEMRIHELQIAVSEQKRQLFELEVRIRDVEVARARDREHFGTELELHRVQRDDFEVQCEYLREEIARLEAELEQAELERAGARARCTALEDELAQIEEELTGQQGEPTGAPDARGTEPAAVRPPIAGQPAAHQSAARQPNAPQLNAREAAALAQLRDAAEHLAHKRIPALIEQLGAQNPEVDPTVEPVGVNGPDEAGQLGEALDEIHRGVVRLAAEQAVLRMAFATLTRRSQSLIHYQLGLLSDLESREADPDQLGHLFRLDHLATRVRRNGENLLVLSGQEPRRRRQPVPLVDVLRGATSEVEQYERIELSQVETTEVAGPLVNDLVHLLAELLENATVFSSPQTRVYALGYVLPDGRVVVEIHDAGVGMSTEELAAVNERLANPPAVDPNVPRRMGLYVVARLARRHGIRVHFHAAETGGTIVQVLLPKEARPAYP